jgi:UDP-N-acetyl-D-mannosaminuronic acid dehydrogenase
MDGRGAKIACMGLAFKPNIDDLRESPALYITRRLISDGFEILAVEPNIKSHNDFAIIDYNQAITEADILIFLVAHKEFNGIVVDRNLDFCGVLNG